jgi:hypothetical protein
VSDEMVDVEDSPRPDRRAGDEHERGDGAGRGDDRASIGRRRVLQGAGVAGAALWVTPTVLTLGAQPAAASTCNCGGATTSATLLSARGDTTPNPLPTTCSVPGGTPAATATLPSFCRADSTQAVWLWGSGTGATGTNGPLFDDMGVISVTQNLPGAVTRYGNLYRFQNFCRQGTVVPTVLVSSTAAQRVYTSTEEPLIWDFLPPQPSGTGAGLAQTLTPTSWWTNSQPGTPNTQSSGNPGYTAPAAFWPGPIDISLLFGGRCGSFTITLQNRNRYQQFKWSNILIGTTHP